MTARLLSGEEAASYCGVSTRTFFRWIALGLLPQKIPHTLKWDRHAIDLAIDRLSNQTKDQGNEDALQRYARLQRERGR